MKRQLIVHGPGGSCADGRNITCSSSSSKSTVQVTVDPPAVRTSTSLTASSAALRTISSTVSAASPSIETLPEKVADATSGSISMWYLSGSIVRGRRNASEAGALEELEAGGIR